MTDADDEFTPPPPRSRFRWVRRLAKWFGGAVAVVVLVVFVSRWQVGRLGERELRLATQRLDADEPGWRLDAIIDERNRRPEPPPEENANTRILALAEEVPKGWNDWQIEVGKTDWLRSDADNHRPGAEALAAAAKMAQPTRDLRARALELRTTRPGRYPIVIAQDPIATNLPHLDRARRLLSLIEFDAHWEALNGNPNRGVACARAALVVARSIGDEPTLVSQLVRLACAKVSANIALQTLAWGAPTEGLAELQAELLAEADVPWFEYGMRGERALINRIFEGLEDGTIPWENLFRYGDVNPGPQHYAAFRAYKSLLPGDRAKALQVCSEFLAASKLPHHEQLPALHNVPIPKGPPDEFRYIGTRLLIPACERVAESALRARADLLCAATAVACERFRVKHGRFPDRLAELVPGHLPAVPLSPFDNEPLTYRRRADRVAISCVCVGARLSGRTPHDDLRDDTKPGLPTGYRLWAPDRRGLPPNEKPPEEQQP